MLKIVVFKHFCNIQFKIHLAVQASIGQTMGKT